MKTDISITGGTQAPQLELSLRNRTGRMAEARRRRQRRAQWWFAQMRRAVEEAAPHPAETDLAPQQILMALPAGG